MKPLSNIALHLVTESTLDMIQKAFAKSGLEYIVLKGPHLAYTVYENPLDRVWGDLDILVKPKDFIRAFSILSSANFKMVPPLAHRLATHQIYYRWSLISPLGLIVELHRDFSAYNRFPVDCEALFRSAEPFNFKTIMVNGLNPEDLMLHLCIHAAKSYLVIEDKHLHDIAMVLRRKNVNWNVLIQKLETAGCRTAAFFLFNTAIKRAGAPIPEDAITCVTPSDLKKWWMRKFLQSDAPPMIRMPIKNNFLLQCFIGIPLMDRTYAGVFIVSKYLIIRIIDLLLFFATSFGSKKMDFNPV